MLARAFTVRNNTDYEDFFEIREEVAKEQYENATEFIKMVECFLDNILKEVDHE